MSGKNFTVIFGQNIEPVTVCVILKVKENANKMHHRDYKNGHRAILSAGALG